MAEMSSKNASDLDEMLKKRTQELDALSEAFDEVAKEQAEERKKQAKDLIKEGIGLVAQLKQKKREFESAYQKTDKALGKIMKRINSFAKGGSGEPETEEEEKGKVED